MNGGEDRCGEEFFTAKNDVTRLFDNIQAVVPGVTTDVVALVVWNTIEDFYQRSTYRRERVFWKLDPCQTVLDFDPYDRDWRVCRFLGFSGLGNPKFVPPGQVIDLTCPVPDSERNGAAYLALKPASLQTPLPYDVMTTYWEALFHGALSRLFMQPGKPYSDLNAMALNARLYRSGIASARADAQAGHLREGVSWHFPYFASGGRADGRSGL